MAHRQGRMALAVLLAAAAATPAAAAPEAGSAHAQPAPAAAGRDTTQSRVAALLGQDAEAGPTAEELWTSLMEGNQRFAAGTPRTRELVSRRQELAAGQHPQAIVLGCADSRVPPELLFDRSLGELFVVRTASNVADRVALGSLEYAVERLR